MEARSRMFQLLKPPCILLNESALNFRLGKIGSKELIASVEQLFQIVQKLCKDVSSFDEKLADYVFFPISQVLQQRHDVPVRSLEFVVQCIRLLLQYGWREKLESDLAVQLLILLTHLADAGKESRQPLSTSDELQNVAFLCQAQLLKSARQSSQVRSAFLQSERISALGHTISVMLDGAKDGASKDLQKSALGALQAFLDCFGDREMLASFFPGLVSSLTQILTPTTKVRRHFRVLEKALNLLARILRDLLADEELDLKPQRDLEAGKVVTNLRGKDTAWLNATTAQVRLALANVVRLRTHDRPEVTVALSDLCWTVLQECQYSLRESAAMVLQAVISLGDRSGKTRDSLKHIVQTDINMANMLRDSLYEWLMSLSRVMLSNDESNKKNSIARVASAYSLLIESDLDMSMIDSILQSTMVDSLTNAVRVPGKHGFLTTDISMTIEPDTVVSLAEAQPSSKFDLALTTSQKGRETVSELHHLVKQLSVSSGAPHIARNALEAAQESDGETRLANIWLALQIMQNRDQESLDAAFNAFVESDPHNTSEDDLCEDMYAFAISMLTQELDLDAPDWRHQALALEIIAFQSFRLKEDFRPELVDALYPIVHLMASQHQPLRNHALTCLNLTASACGYANAQGLLVANVDYVINAVGAKLNTFDLSPEAPQVLLMMIKLTGVVLLPYLDDLIDSIFEALECFHGYPTLVDMLFTVLRGVVEEGAKAPQFAIDQGERVSHRKPALKPTSIYDVVLWLTERRAKALPNPAAEDHDAEIEENNNRVKAKAPARDKTSTETTDDKGEGEEEEEKDDDEEDNNPPSPPPTTTSPSLTKTYTLLTRIASLTQHHLPSSSASIRHSLISLLCTALPYLSHHEDTFLPLVHTLWPVLVPRLEDKEAFVVAGVLDVLGCISEGAGDFVAGRVEGLWPVIRRVWKKTQEKAVETRGVKQGRSGPSTSTGRLQVPRPGQNLLITASPGSEDLISEASSSQQKPQNTITSLTNLTDIGTTTSTTSSPNPTTTYTPTTTKLIQSSLTSFLISLLTHVRTPHTIFTEILQEMLHHALVVEKREDVREALEAVNADAVWLVLERARWSGVGKGNGSREEGRRFWKAKVPVVESVVFREMVL